MTEPFTPTPNPFTMVYDALWTLLLRHEGFASLVKPGNRITFGDDATGNPIKRNISSADLPEVVLAVSGLTEGNLHASSSTSKIKRRYGFLISTGSFKINQVLQQAQWQIFCAMAGWKQTLGELQWEGKPFVKNMNLSDGSEGLSDNLRNRGITGYSCAWGCDIEMHFATADLKNELET
jgi:hypothetical protein